MKRKGLFLSIADLILLSEKGTADWVDVPSLRRLWYTFFAFLGLLITYVWILNPMLLSLADNSESFTLFSRIAVLCLGILLTSLSLLTSVEYFKYVLSKNVSIKLSNVFVFYIYSVIFFGLIYYQLWLSFPSLFAYIQPPVSHTALPITNIWGLTQMKWEFMAFSALQTVNGSFYKIQPNGLIPSLIGWVQSVYTLCLIALLIASYVNQNVGRKEN